LDNYLVEGIIKYNNGEIEEVFCKKRENLNSA
jgi:hypothetical protein